MNKKTFSSREAYVLANNDRHNPCPHCGGEAMMTFHGDNECHAVCHNCQRLSINFDYDDGYADTVKDNCRRPYNILALMETLSPAALKSIGINNGEYIAVDDKDGYICCVGSEIAVARYIAEKIERDSDAFFLIFRLFRNEFYQMGTSYLIEAAIQRAK